MRIAIVEDRQEEKEKLCAMLEQYLSLHNASADITWYPSAEAMLTDFAPEKYQCMFLDIYMEGIDGMEAARTICKADPACRLIFCTDSIVHAVTSYEVRAAWYLIKPLSYKLLTDAMDTVCADLLKESRSLTVHVKGHEIKVRLRDIYYVDCSDRKAGVHLEARSLEVDEPVGDILAQLEQDERFLSCNKNTMLNMDHVEQVQEHDLRMKNGACVPLRQRGRAALKKAFLIWSLRELRREEQM